MGLDVSSTSYNSQGGVPRNQLGRGWAVGAGKQVPGKRGSQVIPRFISGAPASNKRALFASVNVPCKIWVILKLSAVYLRCKPTGHLEFYLAALFKSQFSTKAESFAGCKEDQLWLVKFLFSLKPKFQVLGVVHLSHLDTSSPTFYLSHGHICSQTTFWESPPPADPL